MVQHGRLWQSGEADCSPPSAEAVALNADPLCAGGAHETGSIMTIDVLEALRLRRQDHDFVPEAQLHRVAEGRHLVHERAENGEVCRMVLGPVL